MKTKLFIVFIFLCINTFHNAFGSEKKKLVSDSTEIYINAFKEPIFTKGNNKTNRYLIRLTVIRSHQCHVMITWYPYDDKINDSFINVKKMRRINPQGKFEIFYDKKIEITQNSSDNLLQILHAQEGFKKSEISDWKGPELDGQLWVYEFVDENNGFGLERISPLHQIPAELDKISKHRIVKEMRLTAFGVALWVASNNGESIE